MSELWQLSVRQLRDGYAARAFSPREVIDALADRIERLNPSLGAFNALCLDRARAEADAGPSGPLAGVPFAAKDIFDTDGVTTTYGSRMFASHVPDRDAAVISNWRAAGAILVGKTQTHEFAWGITSVNDAMGSSRNPWDTALVPGGSSGGNGVALAARMVPLAVGTDTGGSVRIPAAFCGVTSIKPTFGRMDVEGVWPLAPSLDHVGPMARTPEDLGLALGASVQPTLNGSTVVVGPGVRGDAVAVVEQLGGRVVERPLPDPARCEAVFATVQFWEAARVHEQAGLYPARADEYGHDVRIRLETAVKVTAAEHLEGLREREILRAQLLAALSDGALLMTPVATTPPIAADDRSREAGRAFRSAVMPNTVPHNLAGIPSCAVRAGFDDAGLPIAVQFAALPGRDAVALGAAAAFFAGTPEIQERWPADPPPPAPAA